MIRPNVNRAYVRNGELLSTSILPKELLWAPPGVHRIQSFGEIINETHLQNILNLAIECKHAKFTLWTKRFKMLESVTIPENLSVIASQELGCSDRIEGYPTFIVSKERPEGKVFKCKGKCVTCGYCYSGLNAGKLNPEIAIWELPK